MTFHISSIVIRFVSSNSSATGRALYMKTSCSHLEPIVHQQNPFFFCTFQLQADRLLKSLSSQRMSSPHPLQCGRVCYVLTEKKKITKQYSSDMNCDVELTISTHIFPSFAEL